MQHIARMMPKEAEAIKILAPNTWESQSRQNAPDGWWAVSNKGEHVAYFEKEIDAIAFAEFLRGEYIHYSVF